MKFIKTKKGFTIIEVLIVLAIAGLIMSIVFLAVPALQRNSRNAQYRTEANRILGVAQEFVTNNNNTMPGSADNANILSLAATKNITTLNVSVGPPAGATINPSTSAATLISGKAKCPASVTGNSVAPDDSLIERKFVLIYGIENPDGTIKAQCLES